MIETIKANWPAPPHIEAYTTTRLGGVSKPPYNELNLAVHVDDNVTNVQKNRQLLCKQLQLPQEPAWLMQTHSTTVVVADDVTNPPPNADASITSAPGVICAVLTADCLPILIANTQGTEIAAIHAGWKGLLDGVIDATVKSLKSDPQDLLAWFGPAIGPQAFEVGKDLRLDFLTMNPQNSKAFEQRNNSWYADIYELGRINCKKLGIERCYGGTYCTFNDERFFSYRQDKVTGRQASLIFMKTEGDGDPPLNVG